LFACVFNVKREIKNVNKPVFFAYFLFSVVLMGIFHIVGGRASVYYCLRLPLLAVSRLGMVLLVWCFCILCSLSASLYVNRFCKVGIVRKIKVNLWYVSYMILCGLWYPTFFAWRREASALFILFWAMIIGFITVKVFSKKCFAAAILMLAAQMIIIYMFFLQLCINILN